MVPALLLAVVLVVAFTIGCTTPPRKAAREEIAPRGDAELQSRFDQFEKNYTQTMRDIRNNQANLGADLGAVRDELRTLRGQMEEMKKGSAAAGQGQKMQDRLDDLTVRVGNIESALRIGKKEPGGQRSEAMDGEPSAEVKTDPKPVYDACYKLFKDGQYARAREDFQKFLKQYPKTAYSGSAQFWIAETWYVEEKYEKAIIEYDKVIKGFPTSDKVPHALLKQGMAFQKLGDKGSAKIVYQQIIKKYPNTNQAKTARVRLSDLK
jgi:tol-pal system protein YbgF